MLRSVCSLDEEVPIKAAVQEQYLKNKYNT